MGKFDSKNKSSAVSVYQLLSEREAAASRGQQRQGSTARGQQNSQRNAARPAPQQTPYVPPVQEEPRRRGPRLGGVIFYTIYFLFIFLFFGATYLGLNWLNAWLVDYEAAQPDTKCEQVFEQLFSDPDWAALYDAAGVEDTAYEGKDAFVAYMEARVGDQELTKMETSAGLSGNKKYIVKLGDEKIASFTLEGEAESVTDIPNWQLGDIELFYQRSESFQIQKMDGHTAYVNGVALTDDFTIQTATTIAEDYLPMGVTGVRTCIQMISGLMSVPTVTVTDETGAQMEVRYDEATRTFTEQTTANTIGEEEEQVALEATKTYALFMIEKASSAEVAKYFDRQTTTYNTIVKSEVWWTQRNNGAAFSGEKVSGYCRYSDDLFSVRVSMSLDITRTDGTLKQFPVDTTLFFKHNGTKWLVFDMTNEDVQQPVGEVRLTFMNGGEVLSTGFVSTEATEINTPMITAPEGQRFAGWVRESYDENGVKTLTIMFGPSDTGVITLPAGTVLQPMTLYAYFEAATEEGVG